MPLDDHRLVIEPTYPYAALAEFGKPKREPDDVKIRNVFYSERRRYTVAIYEREDGKVECTSIPGSGNAATMLVMTLGASYAWGIEQESNAVHLLGTLLKHIAFKQYMLTGTFLETSARSGVTYLFRRLRPTVAFRPAEPFMRVLCTLCLHPIAYYEGTWAGAMCPTDDVIAHLMLMRGDEHMFWKRSNQHAPGHPSSGL